MRRSAFTIVLVLALGLTLAFFLLPIAAVFLRVSPGTLLDQLGRDVVVDALVVTAKTSLIAQTIIFLVGTPAAYLVARRRFRGRAVRADADRAAARAASCRGGHRPARRLRPPGTAGQLARLPRRVRRLHAGGGRDGDPARGRAVLRARRRRRLRGARPEPARRLAHARSRACPHVRARGDPARGAGPQRGSRTLVRTRAGRVRRDALLRRQPARRHTDAPARHLRGAGRQLRHGARRSARCSSSSAPACSYSSNSSPCGSAPTHSRRSPSYLPRSTRPRGRPRDGGARGAVRAPARRRCCARSPASPGQSAGGSSWTARCCSTRKRASTSRPSAVVSASSSRTTPSFRT